MLIEPIVVKKCECTDCKLVWFQVIKVPDTLSCPKCKATKHYKDFIINFHDN